MTLGNLSGQTRNGYLYQGNVGNMSACESWFIDSGDGTGLYFENPNLNSSVCPSGYCFFNPPTVVVPPIDPARPDPVVGTGTEISDLIPFVDNNN